MAISSFTVTLEGFTGLQHVFDKYHDQFEDLKPLWKLFQKYVAPMNAVKAFTEGQAKWEDYRNPNYRTWKHRHGYYRTKLRKTGRMYQSFKIPGSPGNLSLMSKDAWIYGVDPTYHYYARRDKYPIIHNLGHGNVPQRQFAIITDWAQRRMKIIFYRYVVAIMKKKNVETI